MKFLECLKTYPELNSFDTLTESRPSVIMRRGHWPPDFLVQVYSNWSASFAYFHSESVRDQNDFPTDFRFYLQVEPNGKSFFRSWLPSVEELLADDWEILRVAHPHRIDRKSQGDANLGQVQA